MKSWHTEMVIYKNYLYKSTFAWPSRSAQWIIHPSLTSAKVLWEILEDIKDPSVFGVEAWISEASYELWIMNK